MRLEVYKNDQKMDFENSLFIDEKSKLMLSVINFVDMEINFDKLNELLKQTNNLMSGLSFDDELKESI